MVYFRLQQLYTTAPSSDLQSLSQIPAIQRRRLSSLAKMALNSAVEAIQIQKIDYIVWASCFGDEQKTIAILQDILQQQLPSPTQFSTSVHNAIGGLYSILFQDSTPSTSLSCAWSDAIVEAYAYLKNHHPNGRALVVYYDAPLPLIYEERHDFEAFSMAAVIELEHPNLVLDLQAKAHWAAEETAQDALDFYQFWHSEEGQSATRKWVKC